ncbi:MAG TPA: glycosyltransferase family A protein [Flavobacterium sp.]|nr:glycosyltransferase family A protein [Flavobacterium sp.]
MNPQKQEKKIDLKTNHRVVICVFIPKLEGYYADIFDVLKLSVNSAFATKNSHCEITLVNNGSCKMVTDYLNQLYDDGIINCVIHHKENIGKMDALIGAARTAREEFITMADIDILFVKGWQENVEKLFNTIPNVGSVSPISVRASHRYATFSTMEKILLKKVNFRYEPIEENFDSYNRFLLSINWHKEEDSKLKWPVIEYKGQKAIMGSSHQILTIKRDLLFTTVPTQPSLILVGNNSEYKYLDLPIDVSGGMRLSTYHNFAFHMGNKVESWMTDVQNNNLLQPKPTEKEQNFTVNTNNDEMTYSFRLKKRIVKKLFKLIYKFK